MDSRLSTPKIMVTILGAERRPALVQAVTAALGGQAGPKLGVKPLMRLRAANFRHVGR
jgi:hypothetical protein